MGFDGADDERGESRRRVLKRASVGCLGVALAGCSGGSSSGIEDSDGDGVIDSEDYAPNDPAVQEKSDLQRASVSGAKATSTSTQPTEATAETPTAETPTATATATETPTPTPVPTPTEVPGTNYVTVPERDFAGTAYISRYSLHEVSASIAPTDSDLDGFDLNRMNLAVVTQRFPNGEVLGVARSDETASTGATKTITVEQSLEDVPRGDPLFHSAFLLYEDVAFSEANPSDGAFLHETDPFEVSHDGSRLERLGSESIPELAAIAPDSGSYHERRDVEGAVALNYKGRTSGDPWSVSFYIFKAAYVEARRRDHGRSRPEFVAFETSDGLSKKMAGMLDSAAERNGFTGKREKVEFVVDFVQYLPYVPDDVSRGFDDYTLYGIETLAEGGGDCEDTSVLLASILESAPFNYDMVLIQPPGHMAVGILGGDDLPGYYWTKDGNEYYYVETTGTGWGIGDLPDEYRGASAYVYQV